jgi:hypothetical protein
MLKFLLIVGLVLYCIYKIGTLFFRAGAASQQFRPRNPNDANHFDQHQKKEKKSTFKGGDYIDYEEIK